MAAWGVKAILVLVLIFMVAGTLLWAWQGWWQKRVYSRVVDLPQMVGVDKGLGDRRREGHDFS